ncbi:hypothetical protein AB9E03_34265, partial [Rhizobium leguminosarum]
HRRPAGRSQRQHSTPGLSFLIPLFLLFQWLNLLGTMLPQIIIHLVVTVPIVVWIMIGYFVSMPLSLRSAMMRSPMASL